MLFVHVQLLCQMHFMLGVSHQRHYHLMRQSTQAKRQRWIVVGKAHTYTAVAFPSISTRSSVFTSFSKVRALPPTILPPLCCCRFAAVAPTALVSSSAPHLLADSGLTHPAEHIYNSQMTFSQLTMSILATSHHHWLQLSWFGQRSRWTLNFATTS